MKTPPKISFSISKNVINKFKTKKFKSHKITKHKIKIPLNAEIHLQIVRKQELPDQPRKRLREEPQTATATRPT